MDKHDLLREIKNRLRMTFGERLKGVILYGSFARGNETEDSDIDVLVLLAGPVDLSKDIARSIEALYDLSLELGYPISPTPADEMQFKTYQCPLYENVKREGIAA